MREAQKANTVVTAMVMLMATFLVPKHAAMQDFSLSSHMLRLPNFIWAVLRDLSEVQQGIFLGACTESKVFRTSLLNVFAAIGIAG